MRCEVKSWDIVSKSVLYDIYGCKREPCFKYRFQIRQKVPLIYCLSDKDFKFDTLQKSYLSYALNG